MIKLSFIVPVYNVAPYLRKCVDSLLAQDYSDYEIILVDDGSTDGGGAICDDYANTHYTSNITHQACPIRVIHQDKAGLSAARNTGIKAARGTYLCFVDSDDYWDENVLGGLMEQIERENLDVLRFDYQNVNERYEVFEPNKTSRYIDCRTDVVDGETYLNERMSYGCYAVMFIIKQSLIINELESERVRELGNSIEVGRLKIEDCLFKEGIYFEDTEWTPRMLVRAKRVNATQTVVYNYLTRLGSITKKYDKEHIQKKNESLMQVNLSLQCLLPIVKDGRWLNGCIADNVHNILNNAAAYDYESVPSLVKTIKESKMLPLRGYKVRKINQLRYKFINMSPRLYCWSRYVRMKYLRK